MRKRQAISRRKSRRMFRRTAGSKKVNSLPPMMRGGIRW